MKGSEADTANMLSDDVTIHATLVAMSSVFGYSLTYHLIPAVARHFLTNTRLHGVDMGNRDKKKLPESLGIVVGLTYLASFLIFFIIIPFILIHLNILTDFYLPADKLCLWSSNIAVDASKSITVNNGYSNTLSNLAAMTSIFAMLMLGFIDDCYDLRWRYKLMLPFAASVPLLSVYYYSYSDRTTILVPQFLAKTLSLDGHLDLGIFYYIFMLMFVIFCTNAINIYAGINGLEVGQTIILVVTVILYNLVEITTQVHCSEVHIFSLQLLVPFLFCSCALYYYNRFPAKVFVGDSYCYFAGMTIGVVGILGHFSEEILLFAIPQVFNFIVSAPQIFKFVPCPRHRLPNYNEQTALREPSTFVYKPSDLNVLGKIIMKIYSFIGLAKLERIKCDADEDEQYRSNNLTLINLWLCWFGPKDERTLCHNLLRFQCCLSFLALSMLTFVKI